MGAFKAMPEASGPGAIGKRAAGRTRRILIVEDDVNAAEALQQLLETLGHDVALAHDGGSALDNARKLKPEIILCDISLPGEIDGYAVARAVREHKGIGSPYMVALTGYVTESDVEQASASGFDKHLSKPIDIEALYALIAGAPAK